MSIKNQQGWIKLHRPLLNDIVWSGSTPEQKTVLITILLMADRESNEWEWMGKKFKTQPGQMVTSNASIMEAAQVSRQNVRSALQRLEKLKFLTIESTNTGMLITICNWTLYQETKTKANQLTNQQPTSSQPEGNQQPTTNKNTKNTKNIKNTLIGGGENSEVPVVLKNWRTDFLVYTTELDAAYEILLKDAEWLKERQVYHPNLDIKKTAEKARKDFWGTEAGWKHKKKTRGTDAINWRSTFNHALTQRSNQVWLPRGDSSVSGAGGTGGYERQDMKNYRDKK
jgi:hypothetical protein